MNCVRGVRNIWPRGGADVGQTTGETTVTQVQGIPGVGEGGDVASEASVHAEGLGNPLVGVNGSAGSSRTRSTQSGSKHGSQSAPESQGEESSSEGSRGSDPTASASAAHGSVAYKIPLGVHAGLNFAREGLCHFVGRVPAVVAAGMLVKELTDATGEPYAALAVLGGLEIAITLGNYFYFTRYLCRNGGVDPAAGDEGGAQEDTRPPGDSLTFTYVKFVATVLLPGLSVAVMLGGGLATMHREPGEMEEMIRNLTEGPHCTLKYGVTGGPWAYGAQLAVSHVLLPLFVGKLARTIRQLMQSLTRSPITSGCSVGYELPDGSFERLTDHDQQKLNALRDSPYCISSFVLLYCGGVWITGLSDALDAALCSTMIELGLDLNNAFWGAANEGCDGAFPNFAAMLFSCFPESFGASPDTAHLIRCRVDRQPSIADGWQGFVGDFTRHTSVRLMTGAAGSDFPSVMAGLMDLSGAKWPGHLLRAAGAVSTGLIGGARARFLAFEQDRNTAPRPAGLGYVTKESLQRSARSFLTDASRDDKPLTPRGKRIVTKLKKWTPEPPELSSSTSRESSSSSSSDSPV